MRAVARRDTAPERKVQAALRAASIRFQTHVPILGCVPDLVIRSARLAVFVDGDFWHGRLLVESGAAALRRSFNSNRAFWLAKIHRNVERDQRQTRRLRRNGWSVVRLWEGDVLREPTAAVDRVARRMSDRRFR
jgi:DNA mismatch endonuclease, patch repair protein